MIITPFIFNRFLNLLIASYIIFVIVLWMRRNPKQWLYLFPALFWVSHIEIFYIYWLLSYAGAFGMVFNLSFLNDWGSLTVSHALWTLAIIVSGLLARFFNRFIVTWLFLAFGVRGG